MFVKIIFVAYLFLLCVVPSWGQEKENNISDKEPLTVVLDIDHVINAYINAIGGKDKIEAVKDISIIREKTVDGKLVQSIQRQINTPEGIFLVMQEITDGVEKGRTIMEKDKVVISMGSSRQIIEGEKATQIRNLSMLMIEAVYDKIGIHPGLEGIDKVDGRYAYRVKALFGEHPVYSYYDCKSGLKVQVVVPSSKGFQSNLISDYRQTDGGFLYSYTSRYANSNPNTITKIETNKGLKIEDFQ